MVVWHTFIDRIPVIYLSYNMYMTYIWSYTINIPVMCNVYSWTWHIIDILQIECHMLWLIIASCSIIQPVLYRAMTELSTWKSWCWSSSFFQHPGLGVIPSTWIIISFMTRMLRCVHTISIHSSKLSYITYMICISIVYFTHMTWSFAVWTLSCPESLHR